MNSYLTVKIEKEIEGLEISKKNRKIINCVVAFKLYNYTYPNELSLKNY